MSGGNLVSKLQWGMGIGVLAVTLFGAVAMNMQTEKKETSGVKFTTESQDEIKVHASVLQNEEGEFLKNELENEVGKETENKLENEPENEAKNEAENEPKNKKEYKSENKPCIVVDAGHGGMDPGKVGILGHLEKDINLAIAKRVKYIFETQGFQVVMTRESDDGLYQESDREKKKADLINRMKIINESGAVLCVSVHQNSYTAESVTGAQVFYYKESEESKKLATLIREQILSQVDTTNQREIKGNSSYYILKKAQIPLAIVECGFLSNEEESKKLSNKMYQDKLAVAIYHGVVGYLENKD